MRNFIAVLVLLVMTAFQLFSQNSYPKLIQYRGDSLMAFWPNQAKELAKAFAERDHLKKTVVIKDSIYRVRSIYISELELSIGNLNAAIDGYNALAAIREQELQVKIEQAKLKDEQYRKDKRKWRLLIITVPPVSAAAGYGFGKL